MSPGLLSALSLARPPYWQEGGLLGYSRPPERGPGCGAWGGGRVSPARGLASRGGWHPGHGKGRLRRPNKCVSCQNGPVRRLGGAEKGAKVQVPLPLFVVRHLNT